MHPFALLLHRLHFMLLIIRLCQCLIESSYTELRALDMCVYITYVSDKGKSSKSLNQSWGIKMSKVFSLEENLWECLLVAVIVMSCILVVAMLIGSYL